MQLTLEARIARDKARLLAALRKVYMLAAACRATRIGRTTVHDWRQADPEFDAAVEATRVAAVDDLEATTFQLAMDGPWQQQTTLRIFLLKSLRDDSPRGRDPAVARPTGPAASAPTAAAACPRRPASPRGARARPHGPRSASPSGAWPISLSSHPPGLEHHAKMRRACVSDCRQAVYQFADIDSRWAPA